MSDLKSYIIGRFDDLKSVRLTYEPVWDEICKNIQLSDYTIYTELPKGEATNAQAAYDSTASYAAQRLAAVINSVMTNPASEWFQLQTRNERFMEIKAVSVWLEESTKIIRKELENSNFYTEVLPLYYSLDTIGTGCMYIEEDPSPSRQLRFSTRHIREIYADEDMNGRIDTVFRLTKMTARQMIQRFGDDVVKQVKDAMKQHPNTEFEVLHCVYPRKDRDTTKKDNKNLKYASVWMDYSNTEIMSESGYTDFPYVVPRWDKLPGEIYGTSPAYIALSDVLTLNAMQRSLLVIGQKAAEPPMFVDGELEHKALRTRPNAVNYGVVGGGTKVVPINTGQNPAIAVDLIQLKIDRILEIFYNNQLQIIQDKKMTAVEVQARTDENWRVLGAVFGRLQSEMLEGLMDRVYRIIEGSRRLDGTPILPPAPDELKEDPRLRLNYISQLAKAQTQAELNSVVQPIMMLAEIAQVNPTILDIVDFDAAGREVLELSGAPATLSKDPQQVEAERKQRAQAQARMMEQENDANQLENANSEADLAGKMVDTKQKMENPNVS